MSRTAINLYSVRELSEPLPATLDRVAAAGYDGVQFSGGLGDAAPDEVREQLDETGLEVTPPHVGIDEMEADPESVVATYATFGCDSLVVPWLPPDEFADVDAVDATVDRLNALRDRLADRGVELLYHNHDQEFVELDGGRTAFDRLLAETDLGFELDVGWVAAAGRDPVALVERVGDRGDRIIHLKDMDIDTRTPVEIRTGDVDMRACADAARRVGVTWLTYEHDQPADPAASIDRGAAFLATL